MANIFLLFLCSDDLWRFSDDFFTFFMFWRFMTIYDDFFTFFIFWRFFDNFWISDDFWRFSNDLLTISDDFFIFWRLGDDFFYFLTIYYDFFIFWRFSDEYLPIFSFPDYIIILYNSIMFPCIGCAFLTYVHKESAELAVRGLHDRTLLPGVRLFIFK